MIFQNNIVADRKTGSRTDPELPKTGLQERGEKGPGPPSFGKKSQLEPSRDEENVRRDREEPILDKMEENSGQQSAKIVTSDFE